MEDNESGVAQNGSILNETDKTGDKTEVEYKSNDVQVENTDPNSYLNRNEYTSELYKLEVKNLPSNFGFGQLRKLFRKLKLKFVKINAPNRRNYAFVTFTNEDAKCEAMNILNSYKFKGKTLIAIPAKPAPDPTAAIARNTEIRKRKNPDDSNDVIQSKKLDLENCELTVEEKVQNSTTPLWKLTYEEQLIKKRDSVKGILQKITFKIQNINFNLKDWIKQQKKLNDSMCCEFLGYLPSPICDFYRNKCEFSIGYDLNETNQIVGFRLGDYKSGSNETCPPYSCKNISNGVKSFVKYFQQYLNEISNYKAFNVRTHDGHWRQLTIRNNLNNELLVIAVFDKKNLNDDEINTEKQLLIEFFKPEKFQDFKLVSLIFCLNLVSSGICKMDNLEVLYGTNSLYENLFDLKFRISPLAFFQANTKAAEVLYGKIAEISEIDKDTVVIDVCCGTGTIGLTLAHKAKLVVGIEIVPQAIEDAKLNSKLNNIENVEFICGKAEDILKNLLKRFESEKVIAIVDPPRAGLHSSAIQALRKLKNLNTIVYVSCNPELALNNFIDFARPESNNYRYEPFVPIKATGVDMFPHTNHYEVVLLLKRFEKKFVNKDEA